MKKPVAKVIGQDGNVFNIISICSRALKQAGKCKEADKMANEVYNSKSYSEALYIMSQYVNMK